MRSIVFLLATASLTFAQPAATSTEEGYARQVRVQTLLKTSTDGAGQTITYPPSGVAEITGILVEIPPGQNTGWHVHPIPCVAYILEGEVTVEVEGREAKHLKAGQSFAEVVNLRHCGFNRGTVPVKILMFALGTQGTPISRLAPE